MQITHLSNNRTFITLEIVQVSGYSNVSYFIIGLNITEKKNYSQILC